MQNKKTKGNEKKRDKPKRISSCDYAAWDKYDVDTEINRIDLQDEQRQTEMKRIQVRQKELNKINKMAHKATVNKRKFITFRSSRWLLKERETMFQRAFK